MPPRDSKAHTFVGRFLEAFRYDAGFPSRLKLYNYFKNQEYDLSQSTINKYESGERLPTVEHLSAYVILLKLDKKQEEDLLDAYNYQVNISFRKDYEEWKKKHTQRYQNRLV